MSFKETLIGSIPTEWNMYTVKDLVQLSILERPMDGNHGGIHPKGDDFIESGIPFIMASDIKKGVLSFEECKFISEKQALNLKKGFSKEGDVLITHKATIGRVAVVNRIPYEFLMLTPQVTYYRVKNGKFLNNKFLRYYFEFPNFNSLMNLWAGSGSTRSYIGITEQLKLPIAVPSIKEQAKIAELLSSLDEKIELNNAINKNLEEMAQALFKRWFVDFEFPNKNGEPYKSSGGEFEETELGLIPKGWRIAQLKSICSINTRSINPSKYNETVFEHYSIPSFDKGKFPSFDNGSIIKSNKYNVLKDSFLLSKLNPQTKRLWVPLELTESAVSSTEFINYVPKNIETKGFLYSIIDSELFYNFICSQTIGSTNSRQRVSPPQTLKYQFAYPDKQDLIYQFSNIVCQIIRKIKLVVVEMKNLTDIRDSLLPKLMSGEIRIPIDEQEQVSNNYKN